MVWKVCRGGGGEGIGERESSNFGVCKVLDTDIIYMHNSSTIMQLQ